MILLKISGYEFIEKENFEVESNRRVCMFIPNFKVGGAEKVAVTLANSFASKYQIDLIVLNNTGELIKELDSSVNVIDFDVKSMKKELFGLKKMHAYLRQNKPDALLCIMWPLTIVGVLARMLSGSKCNLVLSDHTMFSKTPWIKSKIKKFIFRISVAIFYRLSKANLNVSERAARDLENLGLLKSESVNVINNPIKIYQGEFYKAENIGFVIVTVGSLKWAKNHELLLEAFKLLLEKLPTCNLKIVGAGERLEYLIEYASKLKINDKVNFLGQKDTAEVESIYLNSNLFVLSSHYEGFPMVLLEAMTHALPIVSTDCESGPREILENGKYGKLVPVGNTETLAEAMYQSLNEQHDTEALTRRAEDFSVEKIAKQYLDIMFPDQRK